MERSPTGVFIQVTDRTGDINPERSGFWILFRDNPYFCFIVSLNSLKIKDFLNSFSVMKITDQTSESLLSDLTEDIIVGMSRNEAF